MNTAYLLRRTIRRRLGLRGRGVKVMAFDPDGALLLVRHGYGRSDLWMLPGGGIGRRETPADAARRELREEVGCGVTGLTPAGTYAVSSGGGRDTLFLFRAETADKPRADGWEVIEARFFPPDALPPTTSPATLRRVAEMRGGSPAPAW